MRVLSFIPAILLAATSFVAALPADVSARTPAPPSCVPPTGNDAPLAVVIAAIGKASADIKPLNDQLAVISASGSPDAKVVGDIVIKIDAAVNGVVAAVKASANVTLSGLDLTRIGAAIYVCVGLILTVVKSLISIVIILKADISASLKGNITLLLNDVIALCASLKIYATGNLVIVLAPLLVTVSAVVDLCVKIVAGLSVLAVV